MKQILNPVANQKGVQGTASQNLDTCHSLAGLGSFSQLSAGQHRHLVAPYSSPVGRRRNPVVPHSSPAGRHRNPVAPHSSPAGRRRNPVAPHSCLDIDPQKGKTPFTTTKQIMDFTRAIAHGRIVFVSKTKNKLGNHPETR